MWPRGKTRRASINNFGFGGSNVHFILEQAPKLDDFSANDAAVIEGAQYQQRLSEMMVPKVGMGKTRRLVVLSANSEDSVKSQAKSLAHYLRHRPESLYRSIMSSLALTLQRRSLLQWRVVFSATSSADTIEMLEKDVVPLRGTREARIGYIFTGQGAQWYDSHIRSDY